MNIAMIKDIKIKYVVEARKASSGGYYDILPYEYLDAYYFNIAIVNKSCSKIGRDRGYCGKYDVIGNTFNISLMREIENKIHAFLDKNPIKHLLVTAYDDIKMDQRNRIYLHRLQKMRYALVVSIPDNGMYYNHKYTYYIMERMDN